MKYILRGGALGGLIAAMLTPRFFSSTPITSVVLGVCFGLVGGIAWSMLQLAELEVKTEETEKQAETEDARL
jgi:glucose uptake protein GlcU